uniref:28S ribosomal protein S18a, mitochondrial n=1 Tax=Phallusia mammillata TaxID=59560 RepID=A0A6F9DKM8_9ASCI|nr:28S ribosomal protein S18a, mitochondrial [Phallusia mammillata]
MSVLGRLVSSVCSCGSKSGFLASVQKSVLPTYLTTRTYRKIKQEEGEKVTVIKGEVFEDTKNVYVEKAVPDDPCPLRSRGIQITYEDVLILQQFITSTGEMLPREHTNLSQQEFFKVLTCVKMAQRANLLPGTEDQTDKQGNFVPKLNRYLTRYDVGSRTPIRSRGLPYTKRLYRIGDRRLARDAPRVSSRPWSLNH